MKSRFLIFFFFGFAAPAFGQMVLVINESNPAAVTITATGANSAVSSSGTYYYDGIDLLGFFKNSGTPPTDTPVVSSSLGAMVTPLAYTIWSSDKLDGTGRYPLDLWRDGAAVTQEFLSGQQAFSGSATIDLGAWTSLLPAPGSTGSVIAGYSGTYFGGYAGAPVIGGWTVVVPEPREVVAVAAGVLSGFAGWRRWAKRARR